jgi:hypothetical protein
MKRVVFSLCSLLFAFSVSIKAEISDHDNRCLSEAKCRCEAPGENLYNRRLDQETAVFDDDDDDNTNDNRNRQLPFLSSSPYFVINGVQVLPSSNAACSSNRNMEESNEEDKKELLAELEQMNENESIFKPDEMRKLKGSKGGKGGKSGKSVSSVHND